MASNRQGASTTDNRPNSLILAQSKSSTVRLRLLRLPFPPSVNKCWRSVRIPTRRGMQTRMLLSKVARDYRETIIKHCWRNRIKKMEGEIEMDIVAFPPDKRKRDIDNLFKALLDALEHAGLYENDNQIRRLSIVRGGVVSGGEVKIVITAMEPNI